MTTSFHKASIIAVTAGLFFLMLAVAYAKKSPQLTTAPLGIEIALSKPFYVPATSPSSRSASVFIKVPVKPGETQKPDDVSTIKLEPKMEGDDKVKVTVYALKGEVENINLCRDWAKLQSITIGSYVASVNEEVSLTKLAEYGVRIGNAPLTFRVVPRRVLHPLPLDYGALGCDCTSCNGSICCPNPGHCLPCNPCGTYCCN